MTLSTGIIGSMEIVWAPSDIARVYGRTHSVVHRWIKDPRLDFPEPDFVTPAGKPTWRPDTVREWVAGHKPILKERWDYSERVDRRPMKRQLVTSAALLLALTACGQDGGTPPPEGQANDVSTEAPTPETLTPGTYEYELNGGTMTLEVPATIPQEAIDPIEALRGALNAPEVTYIVGEADNRNGTEQLSPSEITLFDKDGQEYLFQSASTYIGDNLSPTMNEDYSYSYPDGTPMAEGQYDILNEQSIEIYNSHLNQGKPGAKDTQVWIYEGTDFPDEFTNLEVDEGPDGSIMPTPA